MSRPRTTPATHSPIANTVATPARSAVAPGSEWITVAGTTARSAIAKNALAAAKRRQDVRERRVANDDEDEVHGNDDQELAIAGDRPESSSHGASVRRRARGFGAIA